MCKEIVHHLKNFPLCRLPIPYSPHHPSLSLSSFRELLLCAGSGQSAIKFLPFAHFLSSHLLHCWAVQPEEDCMEISQQPSDT